ncbi:unnamed protein product [Lepeophtheirus salmonis]|uniref:(salmon louse) hypothetical protein n=1 Tax=Lepeophtheirus salmonis TaxID=72036 RepID=A0A7R8CUP3_LEPSM|nr:unnamed protein product [Lepeophtheirus salmonis]CAF2937959.1 unnamed protein product [Lepeophtheirus salmonis]
MIPVPLAISHVKQFSRISLRVGSESNDIQRPLLYYSPLDPQKMFLEDNDEYSTNKLINNGLNFPQLVTKFVLNPESEYFENKNELEGDSLLNVKQGLYKRSPFSVDFMGMRVSYPFI